MPIADKAKGAYSQAQLLWNWRKYNRLFGELIKNSKEPIPPLTKAQEREIKAYWSQYGYELVSTTEHRFYYGKTGNPDPRFIPTPLWFNVIIPALNPPELAKAWEDKAYLSGILRGLATPEQVLYNSGGHFFDGDGTPITRAAAEEKLKGYERLVFKPTLDTGTGRNVNLYTVPFSVRELFEKYGQNFTVQLPIRQSEKMSSFNPTSVNAIRLFSYYWNDEITLSNTTLFKIGPPNSFTDNDCVREGRRLVGVRTDGSLQRRGVDYYSNWTSTTMPGVPFEGFIIPRFAYVKDYVKKAHQRFPHFGVIGWDVCLDERDEPIIIEANITTPGSYVDQLVNAVPWFGDLTDEILAYCSPRRSGRHG